MRSKSTSMTQRLLARREDQKAALAAANALGYSIEAFEALSPKEQAIALKMITRTQDRSVTLRIDSALYSELEKLGKRLDQNVSTTIRQILYAHVNTRGGSGKP